MIRCRWPGQAAGQFNEMDPDDYAAFYSKIYDLHRPGRCLPFHHPGGFSTRLSPFAGKLHSDGEYHRLPEKTRQ